MPLPEVRVLPYAVLKTACDGFAESALLSRSPACESYAGALGATRVVVKVLSADVTRADDAKTARAFVRDAILRALTSHPNVKHRVGVSVDGPRACLVTPRCDGGCVSSRLESGDGLSWRQRLAVAAGAASGLARLHAAGATHGSVKASNVLCARDGLDGFVCDLAPNLATATDYDALPPEARSYVDPALLEGDGMIPASPATDVYGLGVVLLELLTSARGAIQRKSGVDRELLARGARSNSSSDASLLAAAKNAGWPDDVAGEVAALASSCVRPRADRRKSSAEVAEGLCLLAARAEEAAPATGFSGKESKSNDSAVGDDGAFMQTADVFVGLVSCMASESIRLKRAAACALATYVDEELMGGDVAAAADAVAAGVAAGCLNPLVTLLGGSDAVAAIDAADALSHVTLASENARDTACAAGALTSCVKMLASTCEPRLRAAGAKALHGLLLGNPSGCRKALELGALASLRAMLDMSDERCRVTASSALSSLADADVEVLQALGAASFVAMAREATKPLARASACAFISKLARNSDTHETIREGGGVETLASMTLRGHAEATWGLASMASCEENWDVVHEAMTPETLDALKRLITSDNEYATEGAAWACCYMAADWRLQLALVKSGVLPPLVALVKAGGGGSRRVKKAAERALKALSSTRLE